MSSIFISYRRTGASGYGGRLQEDLGRHFGRDQVFRDIDSIQPGTEFAQIIDQAIARSGIVLALIGRSWFNAANRRRLKDPNDFVRLELESALKQGIVVLPVLIEGARMLSTSQLPESISRLGRTQALELSDERWDYDVGRLIRVVEKFVGAPVPREADVAAAAPPDLQPRARGPEPAPARAAMGDRPPGIGRNGLHLVLLDDHGGPLAPGVRPLVVAPLGERTVARVRLGSGRRSVDAVSLLVRGCPPSWFALPSAVNLGPDATEDVELVLSPPRASTTRPGVYQVELGARCLSDPMVRFNRLRLRVRVPEFTAPLVTVLDGSSADRTCRTRLLRAGDAGFAISVRNGGNGVLEAGLSVTADDLMTRVWPATLRVPPGGEAQARVRATPRRAWVGAPTAKRVTVGVAWESGDRTTTLAVPLTHRPLLAIGAARGDASEMSVPAPVTTTDASTQGDR